MFRRLAIITAAFLAGLHADAQTTRIRGRVTDAETGEPIAFASVVVPGTTIGTSTDADGIYFLEHRDTASCMEIAYIGYDRQRTAVKPGEYNAADIRLHQSGFAIDGIVVVPGPNPAYPLLDSIDRYRHRNAPSRLGDYSCSTYTKMELGLSNVKRTGFRNKRMQRNFGFVFDHVDTSAMTGQTYLPVMISETAADYYRCQSPALSREIIRASRTSGFDDNFTIAQFTGQLYADIDFYDNYIEIFDVRFASPLSRHGRMLYNYFLVDSMNVEERKTYRMRFHPKGLATPVLDGEVDIDSATYALRSARAHIPKGVNVNWIRHMTIESENRMVDDSTWFRSRDRISADFSVTMSDSSKLNSFIGTREVIYTNVRIGAAPPREVLRMDSDIVVDEEVTRNDDSYWDSARPYELSDKEKAIYSMVDSIQSAPLYRNIYTVINTVIGGYCNTKYVGIGPYFKMFSFNRLEGARFQVGGRTTKDFSRRVRLSGYAAYGTRDERVKGGIGVEAMFRRSRTRKLTAEYRHDVMQLGESDNALSNNNILGSIFSRGNRRLSMVDHIGVTYEHEWRHSLSSTVALQARHIMPSRYVEMVRPDGSRLRAVDDISVRLGMRLAFDETVIRQPFDKIRMGSKYPVADIDLTTGIKGLTGSDFGYWRLSGRMQYRLDIPPVGYSLLSLQGGHIFGKVPYLLLKLPEGNGTYFYDPHAFSCMDFYEFAADSWISFFYEHHFNGFLLGKIPAIKRLKLREVVTIKGIYGTLSAENDGSRRGTGAVLLFPRGMTSISDPYLEMGFGIENILRIARVDFVWRLTHRDKTMYGDVQNFAVNFSLNLQF